MRRERSGYLLVDDELGSLRQRAEWCLCLYQERVHHRERGAQRWWDSGVARALSGISREFYERNRAHYNPTAAGSGSASHSCRLPDRACNVTWNLEPHVAERVFRSMLAEANVTTIFAAQVKAAMVSGAAVVQAEP